MPVKLIFYIALFFISCSSVIKKNEPDTKSELKKEEVAIGTISHPYQKEGCTLVIKTNKETILIPGASLPKEFDIDGLKIRFTYFFSKRLQPSNCNGTPIVLKTITRLD
jgi:hypothetical protein